MGKPWASNPMFYSDEAVSDDNDRQQFYVSPRASTPPRGFRPPLEGTPAFKRATGREGDLVVVQIRSAIGRNPGRRAALRSLGLNRTMSASLRLSSDAATWGNIRKVRDLVAVYALPEVKYKQGHKPASEDSAAKFETYQYGTPKRPAHLWRDANGEYFAYETGNDSIVSFWSSDLELDELESTLDRVGLPADLGRSDAVIGVGPRSHEGEQPIVENYRGIWKKVKGRAAGASVVAARIPLADGLTATWKAPYARFHDQEHFKSAVGIIVPRTEVLAIRSLANATGNSNFLADGLCTVQVAINGTRKEFRI